MGVRLPADPNLHIKQYEPARRGEHPKPDHEMSTAEIAHELRAWAQRHPEHRDRVAILTAQIAQARQNPHVAALRGVAAVGLEGLSR